MTEVEAKALEEEHESIPESADKENVSPVASTEDDSKSTTNQPEKDEEQKDVEVPTDSTAKTDSKPDPETETDAKPDPETDAKPDPDPETETKPDADPSAVDLSVYTEDKLYDDMKLLLDSGDLNPETVSKKKFREALSTKYSLGGKGKIFKKHTPFTDALSRIIAELTAAQQDGGGDAAESEKKEKSRKSKKGKKKKSRKRKRPTSDAEEDEAEDEGHPDPPTKKRKIADKAQVDGAGDGDDGNGGGNDGESDSKNVDKKKGDKDKEERNEDGADDDDDDDDEEMDGDGDRKKTKHSKPKKKGQKAPHEWTLTKLKKLARAVGLANPKMYGQIKEMSSNKKRVDFLKNLLSEHGVAFDNLSDKTINKLKEEYALKREMAELGIGAATEQDLECEDGVPLSTRRPRRKRKEVNYRTPALPKYGDDEEDGDENEDNEEDGGGDGAGKKERESEEEYEQEQEASEEESDAYQPSDVDDDDDY